MTDENLEQPGVDSAGSDVSSAGGDVSSAGGDVSSAGGDVSSASSAGGTSAPQHIDYATYEAEKEKRIRLEAQMEYASRQPRVDPRAAEEARVEQERLSFMSPEEKGQYIMHKEINALKQQQQNFMVMQQFQAADNVDRSAYVSAATGADARMAEIYSKNMGEVEKRLAEYRKRNAYPTREEMLKLVLGEQAMNAISKGPNKSSRQAANNRVISTQGKPVAAPTKTAAGTGKAAADMSLSELRAKAISDYKKQKGVN